MQDESGAAAEAKDKLKLSKSGTAGASDKLANQAGAEELIAKDKAIADANARVKELEKNVNELQKILEIKNKDLAAQQKQAETAAAAAVAAAAASAPATPAAPAPAAAPEPTPAPVAEAPAATPPVAEEKPAEAAPAAEPAPAPVLSLIHI